ncbi:unnamed protein product, partial [Effrenium voratum]
MLRPVCSKRVPELPIYETVRKIPTGRMDLKERQRLREQMDMLDIKRNENIHKRKQESRQRFLQHVFWLKEEAERMKREHHEKLEAERTRRVAMKEELERRNKEASRLEKERQRQRRIAVEAMEERVEERDAEDYRQLRARWKMRDAERAKAIQEALERKDKDLAEIRAKRLQERKHDEEIMRKREGAWSLREDRIKRKSQAWLKGVLEVKAERLRMAKMMQERNQEYLNFLHSRRQPIFEAQLKHMEERKQAAEAIAQSTAAYHEKRAVPKKVKKKGKNAPKDEFSKDKRASRKEGAQEGGKSDTDKLLDAVEAKMRAEMEEQQRRAKFERLRDKRIKELAEARVQKWNNHMAAALHAICRGGVLLNSPSRVIIVLGDAAGPCAVARLGLCSRFLGRQIFEATFSQRLCQHLAERDPIFSQEALTLEMLAVCLTMQQMTRARRRRAAGPPQICAMKAPNADARRMEFGEQEVREQYRKKKFEEEQKANQRRLVQKEKEAEIQSAAEKKKQDLERLQRLREQNILRKDRASEPSRRLRGRRSALRGSQQWLPKGETWCPNAGNPHLEALLDVELTLIDLTRMTSSFKSSSFSSWHLRGRRSLRGQVRSRSRPCWRLWRRSLPGMRAQRSQKPHQAQAEASTLEVGVTLERLPTEEGGEDSDTEPTASEDNDFSDPMEDLEEQAEEDALDEDAMAKPVEVPPRQAPKPPPLPEEVQVLKDLLQVSRGACEAFHLTYPDFLRRLRGHAAEMGKPEAARSKVSFTMKPSARGAPAPAPATARRKPRLWRALNQPMPGEVLVVDEEVNGTHKDADADAEPDAPDAPEPEVPEAFTSATAMVVLLRTYLQEERWVGALDGWLLFEADAVKYPL